MQDTDNGFQRYLRGHDDRITAFGLSVGIRVGPEWPMAEQKTCIRPHAFSAWYEWLSRASMQASGRVAATGQCGHNADVVIWDVATGAIRARFQEHDIEVVQLTFSLDDRLLLSVGQER